MKKALIVLMALVAFSSCNVDKTDGAQPMSDCNCGEIKNDAINSQGYTLTIKNNCSGDYETFVVSHSIWMNGQIGDDQCIDDGYTWRTDNKLLNSDSLRTVKYSK